VQPERTKKELMDLARKRGIKGYSAMTKAQLEEAIAELEATAPAKAGGRAAKTTRASSPASEALASRLEVRELEAARIVGASGDSAPAEPVAPAAELPIEQPAVAVAAVSVLEPVSEPAAIEGLDAVAAEATAVTETEVEGEPGDEGAAIVEDAAEPAAPEAPAIPLKKTWTNHELLIDEVLPELPVQYGTDRIVLMVRDPFWSYAYWDLSPASVSRARAQGGRQLALKVHDVTGIVFGEAPSNLTYDLRMPFDGQRQWYLNMPSDGRSYVVQVGYLRADDSFVAIATSNVGANPISRPSAIVADRFASLSYTAPLPGAPRPAAAAGAAPTADAWPTLPSILTEVEAPEAGTWSNEDAERILATGLDAAVPGPWSARFPKFGDLGRPPQALSSHALSSWALAPSSAQHGVPGAGAQQPGKDFWLVANCELVVYGATEPDATLTVRGEVIPLREDGTFTLRFALPDGLHPIPIKAINRDGDMERNIAFTVTRATTVGPSR
jgi:hypothetical protein